MVRRYELDETQWEVIHDLFPLRAQGRPRKSDRLMLNGILWVLCSGATWRDLPERFGPWQTVYHRFRVWRDDGTFARVLEQLHLRLTAEALIDLESWYVDATHIRASKAASGGQKGG